MVHESKKKEFTESMIKILKETWGEEPKKNEFYSRMINEFHTQRVLDLTKGHGGKVVFGGSGDVKDKYIEPTIVEDPDIDSKIMTEEIFGPVLPIISFKDITEVYQHMREREKPLAMYYFGKSNNNPNKDYLEKNMQSGGMCINEALVQTIAYGLGFGGVGNSGQGKYGGVEGFKQFSNAKSVVSKLAIDVDALNKLVLPPYTDSEKTQIQTIIKFKLYQSQVQFGMGMVFLLILAAMIYMMFG